MSTKPYILVRRTPAGLICAHTAAFDGYIRAARTAGQVLYNNGAVKTKAAANAFSEALRKQPIGTIWGHPSGYDFRILRADFTTDGVAITPGLRVITNDFRWGLVEATQFLSESSVAPGGQFFDHFYLLNDETDRYPYARFDSERLSTKDPR